MDIGTIYSQISSKDTPSCSLREMFCKDSYSSGIWLFNPAISVSIFQTNIPAFHKKSPLEINRCASLWWGFSAKVFTLYAPRWFSSLLSSNWIYPYAVEGWVGCTPMVTIELPLRARRSAVCRARSNS